MTSQKTIVFDLDGTLADTIVDLVAALNRTLGRNGLAPFVPADVAHLTGKGGLRAMIAQAFAQIDRPVDQDRFESMFAETVKDYDQNIAVETRLFPSVQASLEALAGAGWLLAVCTNKPIRQANKLLDALGLEPYFAAVTGGDSFDFKKPDPRHLLQTIDLAGGHKARTVMVGDTQADVLAAQNADIPVIAVDFGYSDVPVARFAPDCVISGFDDVYAKASVLVS